MKKWKISGVLFLCLLLFCPTAVQAAEKTAGVTIDLEYGFQGNAKKNSCFPLKVLLENQGEAVEATVLLKIPVQAENQEIYSSIWMNGSRQESNRNRMYTYQKKISLDKGEARTEIFYLELPIFEGVLYASVEGNGKKLGEAELNCSFSENSSRILVGIVSDEPEGIHDLDGMQVNLEQGYSTEVFVKTIQLKPEDIYPNPDALEQLDLLINDSDTSFSAEQHVALRRWESSGGFRLTRNDENVAELFAAFLDGDRRKDFMEHLEMMQTYNFGDTGGLDRVPVSRRPSMGIYLLLLVIYMLLAGPGIFLFLKKRKKQKYLWTGICTLSVIFAGAIWLFGKNTSIQAPFISYSGLYEQQDGVWTEAAKIGIQAPYNYKYQLYLDNEYYFRPIGMNATGANVPRPESAEQVDICIGEKNNKITIENMAAFTQNLFELEKNKMLTKEEEISIRLSGDGRYLEGTWKNPTGYSIKNAILVMRNRAALLGDLAAGSEGEIEKCSLYSCGNEGLGVLMKEKMDFSAFEYPEYEMQKLTEQNWTALRNEGPGQAYLLGIVENPDLDFQENSGYKIFGSALVQMAVDVSWEKNGYQWCPNLEGYGESFNNEYSPETNLMYGKEATVDYPVDFLGKLQKLTLFNAEYDEEKYYYPFQGHVTFFSWKTGMFEEIYDWKRTLQSEELEKYVSETGVIRIRYLLDDTLDIRDRSCMLPCLQAVGKVE